MFVAGAGLNRPCFFYSLFNGRININNSVFVILGLIALGDCPQDDYPMNKNKGFLLVLATAFISGLSIFINKFGVSVINPYIFTGLKNIIIALRLFYV